MPATDRESVREYADVRYVNIASTENALSVTVIFASRASWSCYGYTICQGPTSTGLCHVVPIGRPLLCGLQKTKAKLLEAVGIRCCTC